LPNDHSEDDQQLAVSSTTQEKDQAAKHLLESLEQSKLSNADEDDDEEEEEDAPEVKHDLTIIVESKEHQETSFAVSPSKREQSREGTPALDWQAIDKAQSANEASETPVQESRLPEIQERGHEFENDIANALVNAQKILKDAERESEPKSAAEDNISEKSSEE
jgi:hypothetical protein